MGSECSQHKIYPTRSPSLSSVTVDLDLDLETKLPRLEIYLSAVSLWGNVMSCHFHCRRSSADMGMDWGSVSEGVANGLVFFRKLRVVSYACGIEFEHLLYVYFEMG